MEPFPFDAEFQRKIIKLALTDDSFCTIALKYLRSEMFESEVLRWAWKRIIEERGAKRTPTMTVMFDLVRRLDQMLQPRYYAMMEAVNAEVLREEAYLRYALADFVQRNIFVGAFEDAQKLYNRGKVSEATDFMLKEMQQINLIRFDAPDRHWFYDEFSERQRIRKQLASREFDVTYPTGIVGVDEVLDGGLSKGELGIWMADSKGGKSLFLVHLAGFTARASQRNTLVILLEGSWLQTASRLDSWHTHALYREVKRGIFNEEVYQRMQHEYRGMHQRLVIRALTDKWNYSAADIRGEIDDLYSQFGWRPDQIIVDYGDLLRSQARAYSEEEHQRNAFSDLKSLTTQDHGYSVWSASQARRPVSIKYGSKKSKSGDTLDGEGSTIKFGKPILGPKDIADSYNKIRRADFVGSINQDAEDKEMGIARLYCALYRDNAADRLVKIRQVLDEMRFVDLMDPLNRPFRPEAIEQALDKKIKTEAKAEVKHTEPVQRQL